MTGLSTYGLRYPASRREDVVDVLHGIRVSDEYRWLEDLDGEETAAWVRAQNEVTETYLSKIPERATIRARLDRLWDHDRLELPWRRGARTFFRKNAGLRNQSVLHVLDDDAAKPRVLLDPNDLSEDGTIALGPVAASPDGSRIAYGLQHAGSDWIEWHVRDVATGADLDDHLRWSKFSSASWDREGRGFYYSAYDPPSDGEAYEGRNLHQRLCYHRVGTAQTEDDLVLEDPEHPRRGFAGEVTDDGTLLVVSVWEGTARKNRVWVRRLAEDGAWIRLLDEADGQYDFAGSNGDVLYFRTDLEAPRGRVIAIDLGQPDRAGWREVVGEADDVLRATTAVGGRLICQYLRDAHSLVRIHETDGRTVTEVELPGLGTAWGFAGRFDDPRTFFAFSSFTTPATTFRFDVQGLEAELFERPRVDFDPDDYETRQVFFDSKDGTRVPMFLTYRKGMDRDGANPTLLYGYGGFDTPLTPGFSPSTIAWLERGGLYAVANLRGGGEYGEPWHRAGMLEQKQNTFDDFIAAAEWLVEEHYTSCERLAIHGGSNGGLLVGACMTQRPELFGACVPAVGVLDMLRFHRYTIGWAWVSDYGSPDDPEMFPRLLAYSPLHRLEPGTCYPPTLILTGDHDDRVVPSHSFKFAARLQAVQSCDNPCLIRVETRSGHGAGKPIAKVLDEHADKWAFLTHVLGSGSQPGA